MIPWWFNVIAGLASSQRTPNVTFSPVLSCVRTMSRPRPVVLSGPSGAGKSTLLKRLMKEHEGVFGFSVSRTFVMGQLSNWGGNSLSEEEVGQGTQRLLKDLLGLLPARPILHSLSDLYSSFWPQRSNWCISNPLFAASWKEKPSSLLLKADTGAFLVLVHVQDQNNEQKWTNASNVEES